MILANTLIVLYCIILYCNVLYCIALHCIVLYCIVFCCVVLCCNVLCCAALRWTALFYIVLYCIVKILVAFTFTIEWQITFAVHIWVHILMGEYQREWKVNIPIWLCSYIMQPRNIYMFHCIITGTKRNWQDIRRRSNFVQCKWFVVSSCRVVPLGTRYMTTFPRQRFCYVHIFDWYFVFTIQIW